MAIYKGSTKLAGGNGDSVVEQNRTVDSSTGEVRWYRLYNRGWLEQGGFSPAGMYQVNFLKPFADTYYTATASFNDGYSGNAMAINNRTTSGFILNRGTSATDIGSKAWHACGYGAI